MAATSLADSQGVLIVLSQVKIASICIDVCELNIFSWLCSKLLTVDLISFPHDCGNSTYGSVMQMQSQGIGERISITARGSFSMTRT
jgi:hypothetical protein